MGKILDGSDLRPDRVITLKPLRFFGGFFLKVTILYYLGKEREGDSTPGQKGIWVLRYIFRVETVGGGGIPDPLECFFSVSYPPPSDIFLPFG